MYREQLDFHLRTDGILCFQNRICVLNNQGLKEEVLSEAYRSKYTIHPGNSNLRENYWWNWMKGDIANFIFKCFVLLTS